MSQPTHYEVLSLPQNLSDFASPEQAIRQAYRRALLRHHPDKAKAAATAAGAVPISLPLLPNSTSTRTSLQSQPAAAYTIDQITTAYTTLSSPTLRSEYDTHLRLTASKSNSNRHQAHSAFQTGIETVDLDDLESFSTFVNGNNDGNGDDDGNEQVEWWFRPCRCGNERGFLFSEADLEEAGDLGELIVGCQDCSLWLRVCFAVIEEDEKDDGDGTASQTAGRVSGD